MNSVNALHVELTLAHGLALDLARAGRDVSKLDAIARALDAASDLASVLCGFPAGEFCEGARTIGLGVTRVLHTARTLDRGDDLCRVLVRAEALVRLLEGARMPSAMSCWLTRSAARLLPIVDRLEYAELFQSELNDLVQSGTSRWAQIRHALRVLVRAPLLRHELRVPARERSW